MDKKIQSALISVFYKDGLDVIVKQLQKLNVTIYSTGGTQQYIESLGIKVVPVESLTGYPSILGGRVKTLHPSVFGGILGRRSLDTDLAEMQQHHIPEIDLVIVDLYPFEETVANTNDEKAIIEKIDIGGPSMIRAAAKNYMDVVVVAAKKEYPLITEILQSQKGNFTQEQRKSFAVKAFNIVAQYDIAIANYFLREEAEAFFYGVSNAMPLRYGENPHQKAVYYGIMEELFTKLNGKELSYNNLVDVDAAIQLIKEFPFEQSDAVFAIIKHTNVCGIAIRDSSFKAWEAALAGDPESAFGGILVCNHTIDEETATAVNGLFFEVLIAPAFEEKALEILRSKKNRILLQLNALPNESRQFKSLLNGVLTQANDLGSYATWQEVGGREATAVEKENLAFANIVCKYLKSNAIAIVKDLQLVGKGSGQTSRIDAVRQAIEKAQQFNVNLDGAVLASDAFFPFNDSVQLAHAAGVKAFIQPGGSIRDKDSIDYCVEHGLAMVITNMRHFKH